MEPQSQESRDVDGKRLRRGGSRVSMPEARSSLGSRSPRSSRGLNSRSCSIRDVGSRSSLSGRSCSYNHLLSSRSSSSSDLRGSRSFSRSRDFGDRSPTSKVLPSQALGKMNFCPEQRRFENPCASAPESAVPLQEESASAAEPYLGKNLGKTLFSDRGLTTTHSSHSLPNCLGHHEPADSTCPINGALNYRSVQRISSHPSMLMAQTRDHEPSPPCRSRSTFPSPQSPCKSRSSSPSPSRRITNTEMSMLGEIVDAADGEYERGLWKDSNEARAKNRKTLTSMNSVKLPRKAGREKRTTDAFSSARMMNIKETPGNETCADCPAKNPAWASFLKKKKHSTARLAVLCCRACAQAHHFKLGEERCRIKYVNMAHEWTEHNFEVLEASGNAVVNAILEVRLTDRKFCKDNVLEDAKKESKRRSRFVKKKYKFKKYAEKEEGSEDDRSGIKEMASDPQAIFLRNWEASTPFCQERHGNHILGDNQLFVRSATFPTPTLQSRSKRVSLVDSPRPEMAKSSSLPSLSASTRQSMYGPFKRLAQEANGSRDAGWNDMDVTIVSNNLSPLPNKCRYSSVGSLSSKGSALSDIAGNSQALSRQKRSSSHPAVGIDGKADTMERSHTTFLPSALLPAPSIRASEKVAKVQDLREKWAMLTANPLVCVL